MFRHLSLLALILSAPSFASIAVYTDRQHPPVNVQPDTRVIYLDATEQLQQNMFGSLAKDPAQAERQAKSVIHAASWPQQQEALAQAYQGLIQAWQLGLKSILPWCLTTVMWFTVPRILQLHSLTGRAERIRRGSHEHSVDPVSPGGAQSDVGLRWFTCGGRGHKHCQHRGLSRIPVLHQLASERDMLLVAVYPVWLHGENLCEGDTLYSGSGGVGLPGQGKQSLDRDGSGQRCFRWR